MSKFERDYHDLIENIIARGKIKENRTGIDAYSIFNQSLTIDLSEGFPILTGKKIFFDKALHEYLWIVQGLTRLTYLHDHGITWWDEYADKDGNLGKTYGYQLRSFNGEIDQLDYANREIRNNTRRAHITLWNPSELNQVVLPPCYTGFTFMTQDGKLNMSMQMRSSDVFLGLPYDIVVAALFLHDMAAFNDLTPGLLGIQITDAHIYVNHLKAIDIYCSRKLRNLPKLIFDPTSKDIWLLGGYKSGEYIPAPLNN